MSHTIIGLFCNYIGGIVEIPFDEKYDVAIGENVIFKDEEGKEEFGIIKYINRPSASEDRLIAGSKILRKATANDVQKTERRSEQGADAVDSCKQLIRKYSLDMQVFYCGYSFDGARAQFLFTADDRVDFRDLVKDLAKILRKQIYLRQIGPRDKAKILGGYGKCGRPFCCNTFLDKLESINMEMVRVQGLESKGSSKLSGACGKLLCCLKYEVSAYKEFRKGLPAIGSFVKLKKGTDAPKTQGTIIGLDVLNQKLKIVSEDRDFFVIPAEQVEKVLKGPQERRGRYASNS